MTGHDISDLVVGVATSYALIGLLVALTIVAVLAVTARVKIPAQARPAFFGLYGGVIGCFLVALSLGAVKSPGQAAAEAQAFAQSDAASSVRSRNVVRVDDPDVVTGSIVKSTVYIQAPDMDRRFEAEGLWGALKKAGIRTPGIEIVGSKAPSSAEVRYFNEADRGLAERVASIASQNGLPNARVRADTSYRAPRGQIELWYPR